MTGNTHLPAYTQADIKKHLIENGASGTVYAYVFPESRQILQYVVDGCDRDAVIAQTVADVPQNASREEIARAVIEALDRQRAEYLDMFEEPWTGRQDSVHQNFLATWKEWSAPVVTLSPEHSKYTYPTLGASEGLRQSMEMLSNKARTEGFTPTIHIFEGEYEGFAALAEAANIPVKRHNRAFWQDAVGEIGPNDQVYVSQPSAIDGNVWEAFDDFARSLHEVQPKAEIMLDLTYVGAVARPYRINADHPNIPTVFLSLSKPFGVYYHRIGGLMSKREHKGLFGNIWFKNLQSLQMGSTLLMRNHGVYDLARKYRPVQEEATRNIAARLGFELTPSDVLLLATGTAKDPADKIQASLIRGPREDAMLRLNVTPEMWRIVNGKARIPAQAREIPLPRMAAAPKAP